MRDLVRVLPPLVALWAYALLAVAASPNSWGVGAAAAGLIAAVLARRAFAITLVIELAVIALILVVMPETHLGFLVLGSVLAAAARAAVRALQQPDLG